MYIHIFLTDSTKIQNEVFVEYKVRLYKIQIKYVNSLGVLCEIEVYRKLYSYYFFGSKKIYLNTDFSG